MSSVGNPNGNYTIQRGDTLSALAQKHGTSVSALVQANPHITNPDLIYTGHKLEIPGFDGQSSFDPSSTGAAPGSAPGFSGAPVGASGGGDGSTAFQIAQSHLGKNAGSLKLEGSGVGADMEDWVPNNVNCANFVSAVLEQAGQISDAQHDNSVYGLMGKLDRDPNFQRVSLSQAKPGDVVSMKTPGGQHVVMFAGFKNGQPQFIGSNNVNSDGSQRVTISGFNYPIMAVHQYRG